LRADAALGETRPRPRVITHATTVAGRRPLAPSGRAASGPCRPTSSPCERRTRIVIATRHPIRRRGPAMSQYVSHSSSIVSERPAGAINRAIRFSVRRMPSGRSIACTRGCGTLRRRPRGRADALRQPRVRELAVRRPGASAIPSSWTERRRAACMPER